MIACSIEADQASKIIDRVVLSSDDLEIISVGQKYGCGASFVCEPQLAGDSTPSVDVVLDALNRCPGYEWVV